MYPIIIVLSLFLFAFLTTSCNNIKAENDTALRERTSINQGWKFFKYASKAQADDLFYDVRPEVVSTNDRKEADTPATEAEKLQTSKKALKPNMSSMANALIKYSTKNYKRRKRHL